MNPYEEIDFIIHDLVLCLHLRIRDTGLFTIVSRKIEDVNVSILERIASKNYQDAWTQEVIHEGRLELAHEVNKAVKWLEAA